MKEAALEQVPLTKRGLLEYLAGQPGPVTAKVASIDLDSRASTVTEMLERCVAQGLVERATHQRPREYKLSDAGRRSLESSRPKSAGPSEMVAEQDAPDSRRTEEAGDDPAREFLTRLIDEAVEAALQRRGEQSNFPHDDDAAPEQTAPRTSRVKDLLERTRHLFADPQETKTTTAKMLHPRVPELLAIERGLAKLPLRELKKLRDSLREQIADGEICEKVARLAKAEAELSEQKDGLSWWGNADAVKRLEKEIAELKGELGLSEEEVQNDSNTATAR